MSDAKTSERAEAANRILRESDAGVSVNTQYAHGADFLAAQQD